MTEKHQVEIHVAKELEAPVRLQEYGVGIFQGAYTKSALKKALKKDQVTVDGIVATSATYIKGGERIELNIEDVTIGKRKLEFPLKVLFEDDYLAIIHKPAGIMVSGNKFKTIANALPQHLKPSELSDATRPQPVHRLDYATTGLLIVGKTSKSIRALNKMFERKEVKKSYYAIAIGQMESSGVITSDVDEKPSSSEYKVMDSVVSERFGILNLVLLSPRTGRRHQLRKHLSSIGNPILGDKDYGMDGLILNGKGMYLHAYELEFKHPMMGELIHQVDELPIKFKKIFPLFLERYTI